MKALEVKLDGPEGWSSPDNRDPRLLRIAEKLASVT